MIGAVYISSWIIKKQETIKNKINNMKKYCIKNKKNALKSLYNEQKIALEKDNNYKCNDIAFKDCIVDFSKLGKEILSKFGVFNFTNCTFENCKVFGPEEGKIIPYYLPFLLIFEKCEFISCCFEFWKNTELTFNMSSFKKDTRLLPKYASYINRFQFSKLISLSFEKCDLSYLQFDLLECDDIDYLPTDDRIRKDGTIDEDKIMGVICPLKCPSEGSFIAWKKLTAHFNTEDLPFSFHTSDNEVLCKLLIPEDAVRLSGNGLKCRASKAKVLDIIGLTEYNDDEVRTTTEERYGEAYSLTSDSFKYKVGEIVKPEGEIDYNRFHECTSGIHFFIDKQQAIDY